MADDFFNGFSTEEKQTVIRKIEDEAREALYKDGSWYVDYKRIRVVAIKPGA